MPQILDSDIKFLPGVGPKRAELLKNELGVSTFRDLLYTFPFRYVDRSRFYGIREIDSSTAYIQLRGRITRVEKVGQGRAQRLVAKFTDGTGTIDLVFFKGLKWMEDKLQVGPEYVVFGKPSVFGKSWNLVHPEVDLATEERLSQLGVMMGVYSSTEKLHAAGITNKFFEKAMAALLDRVLGTLEETLPEYILEQKHLAPLAFALQNIHFPGSIQDLQRAQRRLKFEELFYLELSLLRQKSIRMRAESGVVFRRIGDYFNKTYEALPFPLTGAQKRVLKEIRTDVAGGRQMNRLLQGDVGSGKTLVAVLAAMMALDNGYQACVMAPTEVLANQRGAGGAADRQYEAEGSRRDPCRAAGRDGADHRGDACADRGHGTVPQPGVGGHRRATPVRRGAAVEAMVEVGHRAARAGDDGDADSADAGDDALRRSGRLCAGRAAAGPQTGGDGALDGEPAGRPL